MCSDSDLIFAAICHSAGEGDVSDITPADKHSPVASAGRFAPGAEVEFKAGCCSTVPAA